MANNKNTSDSEHADTATEYSEMSEGMEGDIARDSTRPDTTSAKQVTIVVRWTGARQ